MKSQIFTVRFDVPLWLETPEGLVSMKVVRKKGGNRAIQLIVDLPGAMAVHRTKERAVGSARFLSFLPDGSVAPKQKILSARSNENGEVVLEKPQAFKIGEMK